MKNENKDTRLVRIYEFADVHKGWGDGGTIGYIRLDESDIEKEEQNYAFKEGTWTKETLAESGVQKIKDTFNVDESYRHWHWENASDEGVENERKVYESMINALEIK